MRDARPLVQVEGAKGRDYAYSLRGERKVRNGKQMEDAKKKNKNVQIYFITRTTTYFFVDCTHLIKEINLELLD